MRSAARGGGYPAATPPRSLRWRGPELNRRHHGFQPCALPTELPRQAAPDSTHSHHWSAAPAAPARRVARSRLEPLSALRSPEPSRAVSSGEARRATRQRRETYRAELPPPSNHRELQRLGVERSPHAEQGGRYRPHRPTITLGPPPKIHGAAALGGSRDMRVTKRRTLSAHSWPTTWRSHVAFLSPCCSGSRRSPRVTSLSQASD